jgi:hypothetical protein
MMFCDLTFLNATDTKRSASYLDFYLENETEED